MTVAPQQNAPEPKRGGRAVIADRSSLGQVPGITEASPLPRQHGIHRTLSVASRATEAGLVTEVRNVFFSGR